MAVVRGKEPLEGKEIRKAGVASERKNGKKPGKERPLLLPETALVTAGCGSFRSRFGAFCEERTTRGLARSSDE